MKGSGAPPLLALIDYDCHSSHRRLGLSSLSIRTMGRNDDSVHFYQPPTKALAKPKNNLPVSLGTSILRSIDKSNAMANL